MIIDRRFGRYFTPIRLLIASSENSISNSDCYSSSFLTNAARPINQTITAMATKDISEVSQRSRLIGKPPIFWPVIKTTTASPTPINPSPPTNPEANSTPCFRRELATPDSRLRVKTHRNIPPANTAAIVLKGKYTPTAKGKDGNLNIAATMAMPTPINIKVHGRF